MAASVLLCRGLSLTTRKALPTSAVLYRASTSFPGEGYIEQNKQLGRPLSPSLKLLAAHPHPVWVLSFGHRSSGAALTACISTAAITYLAVAMKGGSFADVVNMVEGVKNYPVLWTSGKFVMALPVCYHLINGMRHLNWDLGNGFSMKVVVRLGYTVLVISIGAALGLAFYTPAK